MGICLSKGNRSSSSTYCSSFFFRPDRKVVNNEVRWACHFDWCGNSFNSFQQSKLLLTLRIVPFFLSCWKVCSNSWIQNLALTTSFCSPLSLKQINLILRFISCPETEEEENYAVTHYQSLGRGRADKP